MPEWQLGLGDPGGEASRQRSGTAAEGLRTLELLPVTWPNGLLSPIVVPGPVAREPVTTGPVARGPVGPPVLYVLWGSGASRGTPFGALSLGPADRISLGALPGGTLFRALSPWVAPPTPLLPCICAMLAFNCSSRGLPKAPGAATSSGDREVAVEKDELGIILEIEICDRLITCKCKY